jgi:hypothetical protein
VVFEGKHGFFEKFGADQVFERVANAFEQRDFGRAGADWSFRSN